MTRKNIPLLLLLLYIVASLPAQIVEQKISRFRVALSGGLGYLTASGNNNSEASVLAQNVLVTDGNVAMNTEIGMDYLFHPNFGLGANLGYLLSTFIYPSDYVTI